MDGLTRVYELEEMLDLELDAATWGDVSTVGGLVMASSIACPASPRWATGGERARFTGARAQRRRPPRCEVAVAGPRAGPARSRAAKRAGEAS